MPRNGAAKRLRIDRTRILVNGDAIRDFTLASDLESIWTYDSSFAVIPLDHMPGTARLLASYRSAISHRRRFGTPMLERGLTWYEWQELYAGKLRTALSITFADIATHNHFALDRGGKVFNRHAPVIKLPESASEDDHLRLLGVLNSSTACFWLQQMSHNKGEGGGARVDAGYAAMGSEPWKNNYEFNGTRLEQFPLPITLSLKFGRGLDALAQRLAAIEASAVCLEGLPTRERFDSARAEYERIRRQMIALQEELDWDVYRRYGLIDEAEAAELMAKPESVPELKLGERAFEIILARKVDKGELKTEWFTRFGSQPIAEIPERWPREYRDVVARRIETIERNRNIGLIERPECKRRWQSEPWEVKERQALRNWLLDRCEGRSLWFGPDGEPRPMTVNRLADRLRTDADVVSVARLLAGPDADLADVLRDIIADEHVPYLAQLRYKGEGIIKRTVWERTWELQREEDRTGNRLDIPVPPKYTSADFLKNSYWRQRGKLDVPKERFISYPMANPDSDNSLLLGWAGWDHREQAHALISIIEERSSTDGWDCDRLKPLLAGLAEAMPWIRQWHAEKDDRFGQSPADAYDTYLTSRLESCGFSQEDLRGWKPPQPRRGRHRR